MLKNSVFHLRDVCLKDWKVTGIFDATEKELDGFQNLDPFHNIDSLATSDSSEEVDGSESETKRDIYIYILSLMTMKSRNSKMKKKTFLMYSMKKVMMNKFKL